MGQIVLIIIFAIFVILAIRVITGDKKERDEKEASSVKESGLKISNPSKEDYTWKSGPNTAVGSRHTNRKKTIDEIYAEKNNMWVCKYCETLNNAECDRCIACESNR